MRIFASRYDSTSMETSIKICKRTLLHDATFTTVFLLLFTLCYDFLSQWNRDECVYCFCIYIWNQRMNGAGLAFILAGETHAPAANRHQGTTVPATAQLVACSLQPSGHEEVPVHSINCSLANRLPTGICSHGRQPTGACCLSGACTILYPVQN